MCVLDILLAVQQQPQQRTKELLNACTRDCVDDIALQLLGPKIRQTLGKCFGESGAKHDDELGRKILASALRLFAARRKRDVSRHARAATRIKAKTRTAMSGLSARTYS